MALLKRVVPAVSGSESPVGRRLEEQAARTSDNVALLAPGRSASTSRPPVPWSRRAGDAGLGLEHSVSALRARTGRTVRSITLLTGLFTPGGAERVLTVLANHWAERGVQVSALAIGDTGEPPFFPLHPDIEVRALGLETDKGGLVRGATNNAWRVARLRAELQRLAPDVVISFQHRTNVLTLLASLGLGIPVIVSERSDPALRDAGWTWTLLRRVMYHSAHAVVCQGDRICDYFTGRIQRKIRVIPNPVINPDAEALSVRRSSADEGGSRLVVALGSLRPVKGFDLLITAFASVAARHPTWRLVIWGDGESRAELGAQVVRLGMTDRILLPGVTQEPSRHLAEADVFVMPSRVEGFPNALCEAMALGLPVVATDVGAVSEIVRRGIDGVLVPPDDSGALAAAMRQLMDSGADRRRLGNRAQSIVKRYSVERVMGMWDELLADAVGRQPRVSSPSEMRASRSRV